MKKKELKLAQKRHEGIFIDLLVNSFAIGVVVGGWIGFRLFHCRSEEKTE